MNAVRRRFGGEVIGATLGFLALTAAMVLLVDGVEHAGELARLGVAEWALRVVVGLPGRVAAAVPVAAALAAASIAEMWRRSGQLEGLAACGVRPSRLVLVAGVAGALSAGGALGLREIASGPGARAGEGGWTALEGPAPALLPADRILVKADSIDAGGASAVRVAWLAGGVLIGVGRAERAAWDGEAWSFEGEAASAWDPAGEAVPASMVLPSPAEWRAAAMVAGPEAPLLRLWAAPGSPARSAWIAERVGAWLGSALLAGMAVGLVVVSGRRGVAWALGIAVAWRLLAGGLAAAAALGAWPVGLAVGLPVGILAIGALGLAVRADARG